MQQFDSKEALVNALIKKALFDATFHNEDYKPSKKEQLQRETAGLSTEFDALYQIFYGMVQSLISQPEFGTPILQLSGIAHLD